MDEKTYSLCKAFSSFQEQITSLIKLCGTLELADP